MIDIFTPEVMDAVVRVTPPQQAFLKNTFFRVAKPEPTEKIRADFYKGKRRVAPFVSPKNAAKASEKIGYVSDEFITPLVKVKDITTIEDVMKRLPGELLMNSGMNPDDRAIQLLTNTMMDFDEQITRREEVMCKQILFDGKIVVIGEGVNYEIDLGFTNSTVLSGTSMWDDVASIADPIEQLKAWSTICIQKGYRKPNICIMERSAYAAFISRCKALGYFNQFNFLDVNIEPSMVNENVTYCGRLRDPNLEIYIYDEFYLDDWSVEWKVNEVPMVPKGKILLASTNMKTSLYYGVMTFADEVTKTLRSVIGTRAADSWVQKEPAARFLTLNSRPLPIAHEIDSWYVAQVSKNT